MPDSQIDTDRLILIRPAPEHLDAYVSYCASARARFVGGPFDATKAFEKFCAMAGHWTLRGFGRYVVTLRDGGRAIGHVGALQIDAADPPEMTWSLWTDTAEGKGIAHEAAAAYLAGAKARLGLSEVIIRIAEGNIRSHSLARRLGATLDESAVAPGWMPDAVTYRLTL
ncbi:MAG: GNAT family N-acetyltransferase [Marivita sp.]|uniref:GNAT family N-acetyltransferase n=1 Tax=Marivita sp. TaxID=2003365 RepID=UPI0025C04A94|nr:GNAT family N-acetyltransferase [Marivita sp.]MCI5110061.1 GNAT family N-acetyltransferase [Marivita sp.]